MEISNLAFPVKYYFIRTPSIRFDKRREISSKFSESFGIGALMTIKIDALDWGAFLWGALVCRRVSYMLAMHDL